MQAESLTETIAYRRARQKRQQSGSQTAAGRKRSQCATRGNPLSFNRWLGVRASMATVQDSMHCGRRFLFGCIFVQILRRTRFGPAMTVESNEACKGAQCVTGSQKVGSTQNGAKHRGADGMLTPLSQYWPRDSRHVSKKTGKS